MNNEIENILNEGNLQTYKEFIGLDTSDKHYSIDEFEKIFKFCLENKIYSIDNLSSEELLKLLKIFSKKTAKLLLTFFYNKSNDKDKIFDLLMQEDFKGFTILTKEYKIESDRYKYRKSARKKYEAKREKIFNNNILSNIKNKKEYNLKIKNNFSKNPNEYFKLIIRDIINKSKNEETIMELFVQLPLSSFLENKLDEEAFLSLNLDYKIYDYWYKVISSFIEKKDAINKKEDKRVLGILLCYIIFTDILYTLDKNNIQPPKTIEDFKGSFFISSPIPINKKLPPSLLDFIDILSKDRSEKEREYKYRILISMKSFFDYIISKKESFAIKGELYNPISEMDIPKIVRRPESNKVRLPTEIFWMFISYTGKILEIINAINSKILNGDIKYITVEKLLKNCVVNNYYNLPNDFFEIIGVNPVFLVNGKENEVKKIRVELLSSKKYKIKENSSKYLINPLIVTQILVALETGLRHQSIQWLSKDFDMKTPANIDENQVYSCFIKTDKSKEHSWFSEVSGRVIKYLRNVREFNSKLDYSIFDEDIFYENKETKWGKYKLLMSFNTENGLPYSDTLYNKKFKALLSGVDDCLIDNGCNYKIFKSKSDKENLISDVTPHSTRVMVVSELINYLPPEYISKHVTGHSIQTVSYYTKFNDKDLDELKKSQIVGLKKIVDNKFPDEEIITINNNDLNSEIVLAFQKDPNKAIEEYGCEVMDENVNIKNIILNPQIEFSYSSTHICPYNGICPKEIIDKNMYHKCYVCPYAIRSVDHLPALCAKNRTLIEEIEELENSLLANNITDNKIKISMQDKRKKLVEEMATYSIIINFLDLKLKEMQNKQKDSMYVFKAKTILNNAYKKGFPDKENKKYLLERIKELSVFPDLESESIRNEIKSTTAKILVNSNNMRELMKKNFLMDENVAGCYSIIKNVMSTFAIDENELIEMTEDKNNNYLLENKKD